MLVLFLHNSHGTPEVPDCGNLVRADWMENLRMANTEPSMHFRETNKDPPVHFRKANTDPSMHFRKPNKEILVPALHPTLFKISLPSFHPFSPNWPNAIQCKRSIWSSSRDVHIYTSVCTQVFN